MFKTRDYLNKNCTMSIYVHISFTGLKCGVMRTSLVFNTEKKIIRLITFSKHLAHTEPIFK